MHRAKTVLRNRLIEDHPRQQLRIVADDAGLEDSERGKAAEHFAERNRGRCSSDANDVTKAMMETYKIQKAEYFSNNKNKGLTFLIQHVQQSLRSDSPCRVFSLCSMIQLISILASKSR